MDWWVYLLILGALIAFLYSRHSDKKWKSFEASTERKWVVGGNKPYQHPNRQNGRNASVGIDFSGDGGDGD